MEGSFSLVVRFHIGKGDPAEDQGTSPPPVPDASYSLHRALCTLSDSVLTTLREEALDGITLFL